MFNVCKEIAENIEKSVIEYYSVGRKAILNLEEDSKNQVVARVS